ncbi:MAG: Holliday junction resolvase RecU [Acholeplasmataceae bacterium]
MDYPIKRRNMTKRSTYANLGMTLESDIEQTNRYYLSIGRAVIHKKPTPVQVVDVSYPARNKAKIVEAYYKTPSTTDFNGVYRGHYIDFDAKETNSSTSMPLKNIHPHQVEHLRKVAHHGGIVFLIVSFKRHGNYFVLPGSVLFEFWDQQALKNGRKSIPYRAFIERAYPVPIGYQPRLDYLNVIDGWIEGTDR